MAAVNLLYSNDKKCISRCNLLLLLVCLILLLIQIVNSGKG